MFDYAIETLNIELFKLKEALRVEERYAAFPEYHGAPVDYKAKTKELEAAIEKLKGK